MMSIKVYKIDQAGRRTRIIRRRYVINPTRNPGQVQIDMGGDPPCLCPRCTKAIR